MTRPILIASSSFDEHTHGPVHRKLLQRGFPVVVYLTDRVLEGKERFTLDIGQGLAPVLSYEGIDISPSQVSAAWYWKVANFRVPGAEQNVSKQLSIVNEITQVNNSVWSLFDDDLWMSSPRAIQAAERKLKQLTVASEVGFSIPATRMSNDWNDIDDASIRNPRGLVVKMFRGVIADQNEIRAMYTTHLTEAVLGRLRERAIPFPGIYQPFLEKAREWRVTVVGEDVFAGAIYTDATAKDDWRKMQATAAVALRREPFPDAAAELCRKFMRRMDLGLGSFDLVEQPDGSVVFLECNPQGQFGFLEETLDLPISDSIVDSLVRLAASREAAEPRICG